MLIPERLGACAAATRSLRLAVLLGTTLATFAVAAPAHRAQPASAVDARALASLKELDPVARLEQRCDMEAMARIDRDKKGYAPERVVAAATADSKVQGDSLIGEGAAVRSKGKWYRLSFVCKTSADHMQVQSFDYKIGDQIPKESWAQYNLYD
jgi:hypothetical protein